MKPLPGARCQHPDNEPEPGSPNLWESAAWQERGPSVTTRNARARMECARCPALDACEADLTDHERAGIHIDGIMAGRYSDVKSGYFAGGRTVHCRACGVLLVPQARAHEPIYGNLRLHAGEGLCVLCHPTKSRAATTTRRAA